MKPKKPQEWWKLPSLIVAGVAALGALGTIIVKSAAYISLPEAVASVEKKNVIQDQELVDLKGVAGKLDGYVAAQQQMNQLLMQQISVRELSDDGEIKEMTWTDEQGRFHHECCSGRDCWAWSKKTKCERDE